MSPQLLSSLAGITLSLLFSYIPGLSSCYETLTATYKRLVMLFLLAVVPTPAPGYVRGSCRLAGRQRTFS